MVYELLDTVVAPLTGAPPAAVSWIRISGPDAWKVASQVFQPWPYAPQHLHGFYGHWKHGDDGIALPMVPGRGFTGEESVEISLHGSRASLLSALDLCVSAGARMADPGEFTRRAFLNGRIDLTQAEAICDTVDALTERQLAEANRNRNGSLRDWVKSLRQELDQLQVALEASVDFSEEIGEFDRENAFVVTARLLEQLHHFLRYAQSSQILRQGLRIALVGLPNAGKSSLMNALLGKDRSIVTAIPGTTRDYIEERADFNGLPVVLIDTAGLRTTVDSAEEIGVQRSRAQAAEADVVWYIYDGSLGLMAEDRLELGQFPGPVQVVANKADLTEGTDGIPVSALTGAGLPSLIQSVEPFFSREGAPYASPRVTNLLALAQASLEDLIRGLHSDVPDDLLSVLFADTRHRLGEVSGETATSDLLDRIFHDFCIGK